MRLRRQLPVYSPLTFRALGAGLGAVFARADGHRARVGECLRRSLGARRVLLTDSGTTALTLALRAVGARRPGAPVALPAYCCYDIATAADAAGVPVVLYDVEPGTLGPEPASLERALRLGVGAVVAAHLYGIPVDVEAVRRRAVGLGATVIEDAAQGVGTTLRERPAGSLGTLAVLSFGRGKGVTGGGGGALVANDSLGEELLAASSQALGPARNGLGAFLALAAQWLLARPALYGIPAALPFLRLGETIYRPPAAPRHPTRFALGVLSRTACLAATETACRQRNAARLLERLGGLSGVTRIGGLRSGRAGYLRLPLLVPGAVAGRATRPTGRALGVMRGYPQCLADLSGFRRRVINADEGFPGARTLAERLITLPTHSRLAETDLSRLGAWMDLELRRSGP